MISFNDARRIADRTYRPLWKGPGTFHVAGEGFEDGQSFNVVVGAREDLVDGDYTFGALDDRSILVDRITGQVSEVFSDARPRLNDMAPVGSPTVS